jgi:2-iminobutanoate/2-iminopropanoate deaminase
MRITFHIGCHAVAALSQASSRHRKTILDHEGLTWTDVVKVTKYLTDIRDQDGMVAVLKEYFGSGTPASTTVCVNQLSTQGARSSLI